MTTRMVPHQRGCSPTTRPSPPPSVPAPHHPPAVTTPCLPLALDAPLTPSHPPPPPRPRLPSPPLSPLRHPQPAYEWCQRGVPVSVWCRRAAQGPRGSEHVWCTMHCALPLACTALIPYPLHLDSPRHSPPPHMSSAPPAFTHAVPHQALWLLSTPVLLLPPLLPHHTSPHPSCPCFDQCSSSCTMGWSDKVRGGGAHRVGTEMLRWD